MTPKPASLLHRIGRLPGLYVFADAFGQPGSQARRRALLAVGLMVAGVLAPAALSSPAQDAVDKVFNLINGGKSTVQDALDSALGAVSPVAQQLLDTANGVGGTGTFFRDFQFDSGELAMRIGGWGDWTPQGDVPWQFDPRGHTEGAHAIGFWDGDLATQHYPVSRDPLDSFLVSPRISLRSLPVSGSEAANAPDQGQAAGSGAAGTAAGAADQAAAQCYSNFPGGAPVDPCPNVADAGTQARQARDMVAGQPLALGSNDPERVLLNLDHHYNFATATMADGSLKGTDGGRIEVFSCASPQQPCRAPTDQDARDYAAGRPLTHNLRATVLRPINAAYQPTTAFASGPSPNAFSGANPAPGSSDTTDTFDLTPWAGGNVWLVFHASTTGKGSPSTYFTKTHFDMAKGFFGWTLDQVLVQGPSWTHNLRIDELLDPSFIVSAGSYKAAAGPATFSAVLINRGTATETFTPTLQLFSAGSNDLEATCHVSGSGGAMTFASGETRRARFSQCVDAQGAPKAMTLVKDRDYTATIKAELPAGEQDSETSDDSLSLAVHAQDSDSVLGSAAVLGPSSGDANTARLLRATLSNPGLSTATVVARVQARIQGILDDDSSWRAAQPGEVVFTPVPTPQTSSVSPDGSQASFWIPNSPDPASTLQVGWNLLLQQRGRYDVELNVTQGQTVVLDTHFLASTKLSSPSPYSNDFQAPAVDGIVVGPPGSKWRDWHVEAERDLVPPQCVAGQRTATANGCPSVVFEVGQHESDASADGGPIQQAKDASRSVCQDTPAVHTSGNTVTVGPPVSQTTTAPAAPPSTDVPSNHACAGGQTTCVSSGTYCETYILLYENQNPLTAHEAGADVTNEDIDATYSGAKVSTYLLSGRPAQDTTKLLQDTQAQRTFSSIHMEAQYYLGNLQSQGDRFSPMTGVGPFTLQLDRLLQDDSLVHDRERGTVGSPTASVEGQAFNQPLALVSRTAIVGYYQSQYYQEGLFGTPTQMRGEDGNWFNVTKDYTPSSALTAAEVSRLGLDFALRLPGDRGNFDDKGNLIGTTWGCPGHGVDQANQPIAPFYCPTLRVAYAKMVAIDAATGEPVTLASFDGVNAPVGQWDSFAELGTGSAAQCSLNQALAQNQQGSTPAPSTHCLGWHPRSLTGLIDPSTAAPPTGVTLQQHITGMPLSGVWTNIVPPTASSSGLQYNPDQHVRLLSPALRIPAGGAPKLQFSQLMNWLYAPGFDPGARVNRGDGTMRDQATLLVRRLQSVGSDLVPVTPFQVVYPLPCPPPAPACDPSMPTAPYGYSKSKILLAGQSPTTTTFDLSKLPVYDYMAIDPASTAPDAPALRNWDLTQGDGALVQFAFQVDTDQARPNHHPESCVPVFDPILKVNRCDEMGWLLDSFQVSQDSKKGYDAAITSASLVADGYDWTTLGLGPGSSATLTVNLLNTGLFQLSSGRLDVILHNNSVEDTISTVLLKPTATKAGEQVLSIRGGETAKVPVRLHIPDHAGNYQVVARLRLTDIPAKADPTDAPGFEDEQPADNCAVVQPPGVGVPSIVSPCDVLGNLKNQRSLDVEPVEDLHVAAQVQPVDGRVGFARILDLSIRNTGNVPVRDAAITFGYRNLADPADALSQTWKMPLSPMPGNPVSWHDIPLDQDPLRSFTLRKTATYLVTASVDKDQGPFAAPLHDAVAKLAYGYDTYYADDFDTGMQSQHATAVSGTLHAEDGWNLDRAQNLAGDLACCAWRFGWANNNTYPSNADRSLVFPMVDLSTASKAVFSIAHKQDLENGYDGARLEATTDGGATWFPLIPKVPLEDLADSDCPSGMVALRVGTGLCAVPQVAGTCPTGTATGTSPAMVAGIAVCAISPLGGDCSLGFSPQVIGSVAICVRLPVAGTCPNDYRTMININGRDMCVTNVTADFPTPCEVGQIQFSYTTYRVFFACALPRLASICPDGSTVLMVNAVRLCFVPAGYGGLVQPSSGLNGKEGQRDPTHLVSAYTGDSSVRFPGHQGWQVSEFDLSQVPGFTTPVQLTRFGTEGFPVYDRQAKERTSLGAWCESGRSPASLDGGSGDDIDAEHCWLRDNLHYDRPFSDPEGQVGSGPDASHRMWWSGTSDNNTSDATTGATSKAPGTTLQLNVPAIKRCDEPGATSRCLINNDRYRLVYWWQDTAPRPNSCMEQFSVQVGTAPAAPASTFKQIASGPDGWKEASIILRSVADATTPATVKFSYTDPNDDGFSGNTRYAVLCNLPARGALIDNVRFEVIGTESGRDFVYTTPSKGADYVPLGDTRWSATVVNPSPHALNPIGWAAATHLPIVPSAWNPRQVPDHEGSLTTAWVMGDPSTKRYPIQADERLVTPAVSLQAVGGSEATLTFWDRYDVGVDAGRRNDNFVSWADRRAVLVQPFDDGSRQWGAWQTLSITGMFRETQSGKGELRSDLCEDAADHGFWCRESYDLSAFVGKKVRFGFELISGRIATTHADAAKAIDPDFGLFWMVDKIGVAATTFTGGPLQLRMHAATDGSLDSGSFLVDNPQLVGFPYRNDVAVIAPLDALRGAPGETLHLNGEVRNLADQALATNLVLQARALPQPGSGCVPDPMTPVIVAHGIEPGTSEAGVAQSKPFTLALAGNRAGGLQNDRMAFQVDLPLPANCSLFDYSLQLRLLHIVGGTLTALVDENLGDHERDFDVVASDQPDLGAPKDGRSVTPLTSDVDSLITANVPVTDLGMSRLQRLQADFTVTRFPLDGSPSSVYLQRTVLVDDVAQLPQPGGVPRPVAMSFHASLPGFYRIDVDLKGHFANGDFGLPTTLVGRALVGATPLFWKDDLEDPAKLANWASADSPAYNLRCSGRPVNPTPVPTSAPSNLRWHTSTRTAHDGATSFFVGTDDPVLHPYPTSRDEMLRLPAVDLSFLRDIAQDRDSPFSPDLTFRYKPLLGDPVLLANNGVIVQAVVTDDQGLSHGPATLSSTNYDGIVSCQGGNPPDSVNRNNPLGTVGGGAASQQPAMTGMSAATWRNAVVPQASIPNPESLNQQIDLPGTTVQNILRFGSGDTQAVGFYADSFAMSSYRSSATPAMQNADLTTGADKTFLVRVQNTGAAPDVFKLSIDPAATQPEQFTDGTIPVLLPSPPEVALDPGATALVPVRVKVPNEQLLQPVTAGDIVLVIASSQDPNQVATSTIHIGHLDPTPLPHLSVSLQRPASDAKIAQAQTGVSFLTVVQNDGQAPAPSTDLMVVACPGDAERAKQMDPEAALAADLRDCRLAADPSDPHWPVQLKATTVPPLPSPRDVPEQQASKTTFTKPVTWVLPMDAKPFYRILAVADARSRVHMYEPRMVGHVDLDVQPLQHPDLAVHDLRVQDANGAEVTQGFAGDLLRISATITNHGTSAAQPVQAKLSAAGLDLLLEDLGTLQPGESRTLQTTWVATAGNVIVEMQAWIVPGSGPMALEDTADNHAFASLAVQQGTLKAGFVQDASAVEGILLAPGQAAQVGLHLANTRDAGLKLRLPTLVPDGLTLLGLPAGLDLGRGERTDLLLSVAASPLASVGPHTVQVNLLSEDGLTLATVLLEVTVGAPSDPTQFAASAEPLVMGPGQATALVRIIDTGSPGAITLAAQAPPGWNVTLPLRQLNLPARGVRTLSTQVEVPASAAPGDYQVLVRGATAAGNDRTLGTLAVHVTAQPAWHSVVAGVRRLGDASEAIATVTNVGNALGVPDFGAGTNLQVTPTPQAQSPGESQVYHILLSGAGSKATWSLPGASAANAPQNLGVPLVSSGFDLVRWETLPATGAHAGQPVTVRMTLHDSGKTILDGVPLRVYADGVLVAAGQAHLEPGLDTAVDLVWHPVAGDPVLVVSAGEVGHEVAQSGLLHVQPAQAAKSAPGAGPLLWLVLLGACLVRRRRA